MSNDSLQKQLIPILKKAGERAKPVYFSKVQNIIGPKLADGILELLTTKYKYLDVTGNLTTGWYVAFYVRGKLAYMKRSKDILPKPTRKTLVENEVYRKKFYWGGAEAKNGQRYKASSGTEHYFAFEIAKQKAESKHIKYARDINRLVCVVGNGAQYATFKDSEGKLQGYRLVKDYLKNQGWNFKGEQSSLPF